MRDEHYTPFKAPPSVDPPPREAVTVFVLARVRGDRTDSMRGSLRADPHGMVARMAGLCGVDRDRLRLWMFARCVVEWLWFDVDGVVESLAP